VLRVKSDAWVQVREKQGPVLLARLLRGGESWPVPKGQQLLLTTGNAGGTELVLDGAALPSLGASGAVRRDVALEPEALKPAAKP
jgi:cytoskeleton protein RodZ